MHQWGDEGVDWAGIDAAAAYIGLGLRKWGRVSVSQFKEKYGTVRVYCSLGVNTFHQLWRPGYMFCRYKWEWLWKLDLAISYAYPRFLERILEKFSIPNRWVRWINLWTLLNLALIWPYHKWLYKRYYRQARRKWPHLAQEIYRAADWYELLGARVTNGTIWWPEWDEEPREEGVR